MTSEALTLCYVHYRYVLKCNGRCRTMWQCRCDVMVSNEAAQSSVTAAVDRPAVVIDDPVLPVQRHKSRHAAVPAVGTDDAVTPATVSKPASDGTAAAGAVEPRRRREVTERRRVYSDSEADKNHTRRDSVVAISSLSASVGNLPRHAAAVTSLDWSNDVSVTSAECAGVPSVTVDDRTTCEPGQCMTAALYAEPRDISRRGRNETSTTTRQRGSSCLSLHRNTSPTNHHQQQQQQQYDWSSSDNDCYESVDYNQFTSTSDPHTKHRVRHSFTSRLYRL